MSPGDAAVLVKVVESWLLLLRCQGGPPPAPDALAALGRLALAAPVEAARCPRLLRHLGPRVAYAVEAQAIAVHASEQAAALTAGAQWLTTAQAASALGITADGVRWLLRRGQLDGHRTETGWRVAAASVRARRLDRAA